MSRGSAQGKREEGEDGLFFSECRGVLLWSESKQTASLEKITRQQVFPTP